MTPEESDPGKRFDYLVLQGNKFCRAVGLQDNTALRIFNEDSDWAFLIKIDALIETACRETVKGLLRLEIDGVAGTNDSLKRFAESLNVRGRPSLIDLLEAAGCPDDNISFISSIRQLRNEYSHNIRNVEKKLETLINNHDQRKSLLKNLTQLTLDGYKESDLTKAMQADPVFMRFAILDGTLSFLALAYHVALKDDSLTKGVQS